MKAYPFQIVNGTLPHMQGLYPVDQSIIDHLPGRCLLPFFLSTNKAGSTILYYLPIMILIKTGFDWGLMVNEQWYQHFQQLSLQVKPGYRSYYSIQSSL